MAARILPPSIYVTDTGTPKRTGAFAARSFAAGELVEACRRDSIERTFQGPLRSLWPAVHFEPQAPRLGEAS